MQMGISVIPVSIKGVINAVSSSSAARWRWAWPQQPPACRCSGDEDTDSNSDGGGTDNNQLSTKRSNNNGNGNSDNDRNNDDDGNKGIGGGCQLGGRGGSLARARCWRRPLSNRHSWWYHMGSPPCLILMVPVVGSVAHDSINVIR